MPPVVGNHLTWECREFMIFLAGPFNTFANLQYTATHTGHSNLEGEFPPTYKRAY